MRDIEVINRALREIELELAGYFEPGQPRDAHFTIERIFKMMDSPDVIAARARIDKGYGQLRLVK
jgi:hypothetical protein